MNDVMAMAWDEIMLHVPIFPNCSLRTCFRCYWDCLALLFRKLLVRRGNQLVSFVGVWFIKFEFNTLWLKIVIWCVSCVAVNLLRCPIRTCLSNFALFRKRTIYSLANFSWIQADFRKSFVRLNEVWEIDRF